MRLFATTIFLLSLFSCGVNEEHSGKKEPQIRRTNEGRYYGGTFRLNETEYIRTIFPPSIKDVVSARVASLFFEGLFELNPVNLNVEPCLVESYSVDSTGTIYTFRLKDSIYFHRDAHFKNIDPRKLNSDDIRFCIENLLTKRPYNTGYEILLGTLKGSESFYEKSENQNQENALSGFERIDDLSFRLVLEKPDVHFLQKLSRHELFIYLPEAYYKFGINLIEHPVGTGPFILEKVNEGSEIILARNEQYHGTDKYGNRLPYLDNIVVRFVQDKKTELALFQEGKLEMIYRLPQDYISEILEDSYEDRGGKFSKYQLQHSPEMMTQILGFNTKSSVFSDINLRKAIAFAIDRKHILDNILMGEGYGPGIYGITPPCFESYISTDVRGYSFNSDSAKYYFIRSDFNRQKNEQSLKLWLNSDGHRNTNISVYIQEQLSSVLGLKIDLEIVPLSVLQEKITDGTAEFYRIGWLADIPSPKSFLTLFYGKHIRKEGVYPNIFRYQNRAFDQLFEMAGQSLDIKQSNELYLRAEKLVSEDCPFVALWYDEGYRLLQPYVKNFPNNPMQYRNFKEVFFEKPETLAPAEL